MNVHIRYQDDRIFLLPPLAIRPFSYLSMMSTKRTGKIMRRILFFCISFFRAEIKWLLEQRFEVVMFTYLFRERERRRKFTKSAGLAPWHQNNSRDLETALLPIIQSKYIMILRPRLTAYLQKTPNLSSAPLFDFLVPALSLGPSTKPFSSTSYCSSRIGSAPLSLPTEVNLRVIEPLPPKKSAIRTAEPQRTIEVEGPLGM